MRPSRSYELKKVGVLDLGTMDCDSLGNFSLDAQTMDDLADIIEDVGVESGDSAGTAWS